MNRGKALFFAALLVIGFLSALPALVERAAAERSVRTVDIVLDREEYAELARSEGVELADLLARLARAGATSLAVKEKKFETLQLDGRATVIAGHDLLARMRVEGAVGEDLRSLKGTLRPSFTYALIEDEETAGRVEEALRYRLPEFRRLPLEGGTLFELPLGLDRALKLGLGFWPEDIALAREVGLRPLPRPIHSPDISAEGISHTFSPLAETGAATVLFEGDVVAGYPEHLEEVAEQINSLGLNLGLIEAASQRGHLLQAGLLELLAMVDGRAVRVYSIPRPELDKMNLEALVQARINSAKDRNIRVIYLRPILVRKRGVDLVEQNVAAVRLLVAGLHEAGFSTGSAPAFPVLEVAPLSALGVTVVVLVGALVLVELLYPLPLRAHATALLLLGLLWFGAHALAPLAARQATAFMAAVMAPTLAMVLAMRGLRGGSPRVVGGISLVLLASAVSTLGGLLIGAVLGDRAHLLELELFHGVAVAYVAPILLTFLFYPACLEGDGRFRWTRVVREATQILRTRLRVQHLVLFALLALTAFLYAARSGHALGVPVPGLELAIREVLSDSLYARPRFKEFALGHPLLLLASYLVGTGRRGILPYAVLAGAIGQVSIVNSFEHLRTPLLVSVLRTANGLVLGIALGVLAVLLVGAILNIARRRKDSGA